MHRILSVAIACLCLLLASCTLPGETSPTPALTGRATTKPMTGTRQDSDDFGAKQPRVGSTCTLSHELVPSCGVLWGANVHGRDASTFMAKERVLRRQFDIYYRYHDVEGTIPDAAERAVVRQGTILHVAIAARVFGDPKQPVTWRAVAKGEYDRTLREQAKGVAALGKPVFITFGQEASQRKKFGRLGNGADFIAAWRHLHDIYQKAGADQAVWVWVMTGDAKNLVRAAQLWPGNRYVDWISWNVYNLSKCQSGRITLLRNHSFENRLRIFYDWVHRKGPRYGIDAHKPMMISETGSVLFQADPAITAKWYADIPKVLRRYPQIRAVQIWDSYVGDCDFRIGNNELVLGSIRRAGRSSWIFRLPHPVLDDGAGHSVSGGGSE